MADIKQAAKWLEQKKKVRRPCWDDHLVWARDSFGLVELRSRKRGFRPYPSDLLEVDDLLADDWEIAHQPHHKEREEQGE